MMFAPIDYIFAALLIIFVLRCALRGFVEELLSMAAIVLGLIVGFLLFKNGAAYIKATWGITVFPELIAFIILFVITFVLIKILQAILHDIIERIQLDSMNHLFGVLLGLVEGILVISLILLVLAYQPLFDPAGILKDSFFAHILLPLIGELQRNHLAKPGA
ncbi:MAG: CvpA family protein [Termitinemataceae bacterium]